MSEAGIGMSIKNITDRLQNMNDSTAIFMFSVINMIILLLAILMYFYYTGTIFSNGLRARDCSFMDSMYGKINGKIASINTSNKNFQQPLRDYYIKTAYNACSGGDYKNDYVDTCVVKSLLKQGVRALDFEIYSIDDVPVVATSTNDNYCVKETFNYVTFGEVLNVISNYAFTMSTAPNPADPLFIHLRIKSNNKKMFEKLTALIENFNSSTGRILGPNYSYSKKNLASVPLNEMAGKVIIMVDGTNKTFLETKFNEFVNIVSKSAILRGLTNYEIVYTPDMNELINHNRVNMTIGVPDKGSSPPNPNSLIMRNNGCQFIAMRYQMVDAFLEENNTFFEENGTAFVLKPDDLRYKVQTIPAPPPQNERVSYETKKIKTVAGLVFDI
jgi:hypothetical protein